MIVVFNGLGESKAYLVKVDMSHGCESPHTTWASSKEGAASFGPSVIGFVINDLLERGYKSISIEENPL